MRCEIGPGINSCNFLCISADVAACARPEIVLRLLEKYLKKRGEDQLRGASYRLP